MLIKLTPIAKDNLRTYLEYVAKDDYNASVRFYNKAMKELDRLLIFPYSGKKISEFPDKPFREVLVKPLRFFYEIQGEKILVFAVWHTSQIPKKP